MSFYYERKTELHGAVAYNYVDELEFGPEIDIIRGPDQNKIPLYHNFAVQSCRVPRNSVRKLIAQLNATFNGEAYLFYEFLHNVVNFKKVKLSINTSEHLRAKIIQFLADIFNVADAKNFQYIPYYKSSNKLLVACDTFLDQPTGSVLIFTEKKGNINMIKRSPGFKYNYSELESFCYYIRNFNIMHEETAIEFALSIYGCQLSPATLTVSLMRWLNDTYKYTTMLHVYSAISKVHSCPEKFILADESYHCRSVLDDDEI